MPAVQEALEANAGIPDMELVDPTAPGFAHRAAFLLNRDGYCVVKNVLDEERLAKIRRGCEIAIRELVGRDPERSGNRGSHRYSFQDNGTPGSPNAVVHFGLQDYWAVLLDPPAVMEIMEAVFGTKEFAPNGVGGGDFNIPGSVEYQHLHSDGPTPDVKLEYRNDGNRYQVPLDAKHNPDYRYQVVNTRDLPLREFHVTANYPMEICKDSTVGHTASNGATRQIPNTQALDARNGNPIPTEDEEPLWMKMAVTQPCPAGVGYRLLPENPTRNHTLPYESWEKMTPMGQYICRYIVCDEGEEIPSNNWKPHWHNMGTQVGQNHKHTGAKVDNPFVAAATSPKL